MANLSNKKAQTHHSQNWPCTATIHQWRSLRLECAYSLGIDVCSLLLFRGASSFWEASMICVSFETLCKIKQFSSISKPQTAKIT